MRFGELEGLRVGVWGAGREIRSLAAQIERRLPAARIAVAAFDGEPPADAAAALRSPAVQLAVGERIAQALAGCDVVVRSPGVSIHRPEVQGLRRAGVPVVTATGLWLAERGGQRVIGVTGTKGKSTTAALACHLARAAGAPARLAGNIGVPALELLDAPAGELAVVELSSYQIADLETGPEIALVCNLYREHLDWHGSERAYRSEKLRLLALPAVRAAVLNARQPELAEAAPAGVELRAFGMPAGWDVRGACVARGGQAMIRLDELPLAGEHNALNLCGALTALEAAGIEPPPLARALAGFRALPHRLQTVAQARGAQWVDDSISTTPESTLAALRSFPGRRVVLIAGGQDRGQDYGELARALAADADVTLIGVPSTGARLLADATRAGVPRQRALAAEDLAGAVALARTLAQPGSVVLLSPAAPSYDSFRDFEQRGERFQSLVAASAAP